MAFGKGGGRNVYWNCVKLIITTAVVDRHNFLKEISLLFSKRISLEGFGNLVGLRR